jgi:hypothetical protein
MSFRLLFYRSPNGDPEVAGRAARRFDAGSATEVQRGTQKPGCANLEATVAAIRDLAQVNIMRLRAPLDSPELAAFVAALDPVNALADQAAGFVWRLETDEGNSTAVRIFEDDTLLVNMSTGRSFERMTDYVYPAERQLHLPIALPRLKGYQCDGEM